MSSNPWYSLGIFQLVQGLTHMLPRNFSQLVGEGIGHASFALARRAVAAQRENLARIAPLDAVTLDRLVHRNLCKFFEMLADYFYCIGSNAERIRPLIGETLGFEHIRTAREAGKGGILITGHLGNWELGGLLLALDDVPVHVVTLPEPSPRLSKWREEYRRRLGIRTITVGTDKFSFIEMIQALRRGEFVAMLVDRPYGGSGQPVRLFGHDTEFSSAPALLWQHTGAPVLPAFVLRRADDLYTSMVEEPVELLPGADPHAAQRENTQRIAARFERVIRAYPDQWYNYVPLFQS